MVSTAWMSGFERQSVRMDEDVLMTGTTTSPDRDARAQRRERLELDNDEDEIAHLVCCRSEEWLVALCGEESTSVNLTPACLCTMCVEVANRLLPGCFQNDPLLCPIDHQPCPDEHDLDLRILREVSPPGVPGSP